MYNGKMVPSKFFECVEEEERMNVFENDVSYNCFEIDVTLAVRRHFMKKVRQKNVYQGEFMLREKTKASASRWIWMFFLSTLFIFSYKNWL